MDTDHKDLRLVPLKMSLNDIRKLLDSGRWIWDDEKKCVRELLPPKWSVDPQEEGGEE